MKRVQEKSNLNEQSAGSLVEHPGKSGILSKESQLLVIHLCCSTVLSTQAQVPLL